MNWLQQQTTLYRHNRDVTGVPRTLRQVLLCDFNRDINALCALHRLDRNAADYKQRKNAVKATLQGYTPAALMQSRAKDNIIVTSRTGLMQLDFDYAGIKDYDIEELKQAVFSLPFIAFCGLSCSGDGFYALALIAEPERGQTTHSIASTSLPMITALHPTPRRAAKHRIYGMCPTTQTC